MYKLLVILAVIATAFCQTDGNNGDLASIIEQIFGNNPNNNAGNSGQSISTTKPTPILTPPPNLVQNKPSTIVPPITNNIDDTSCTNDDGQVGECVRYYQCDDVNGTIIDDGVGIIDIRARDGPCSSYMDTCCLAKRATNNPITPAPDTTKEKEGCGWRNLNGVGMRIKEIVDSEAQYGEFPWMVALLKTEPVNANDPNGQRLNVYVGGGALIHPSIVLTAAHSVAPFQDTTSRLHVRAGEWDTQTKNEIYPYQDRAVSEIVVHKDFNKGNLFYDVAILFLQSPVDSAPHIGVACLPLAKERAQTGLRCQASGWGKDNFGKDGRYQVILKRVEVPVVDRNTCQQKLRTTRLGRFFMLHSSFMCAGGEDGRDTCKGDGGSPLVCPVQDDPQRYIQYGIVAWGIGCGENGIPGVYVDVANLRDWIDDKVTAKGYDPNTYTYR